MTLDEVKEAISTMSVQDRYQVLKALKALDSLGIVAHVDRKVGRDDISMAAACLSHALQSKGIEFSSVAQLRKRKGFSDFASKIPNVMKYLRKQTPKRIEQQALLDVGVRLLINHMYNGGQFVSAPSMMANINLVPAVMNEAFPGYAHSGILAIIVRKEKHVREKLGGGQDARREGSASGERSVLHLSRRRS